MGGNSGSSAPLAAKENGALAQLQAQQSGGSNPAVQSILAQYGQGGMSLQDALSAAGKVQGTTSGDPYADQRRQLQAQVDQTKGVPGVEQAAQRGLDQFNQQHPAVQNQGQADAAAQAKTRDMLATDPITGSMVAGEMVRTDPGSSGLFGKGGIQDQAQGRFGSLESERQGGLGLLNDDRNSLMGRDESYGLKNSDLAAYGQASGNIGRLFGNQEQNLAQSLADRGLGAAPSGAAVAGFSGLMGNKNEQLAGMQQQIAQNRIQTAQSLANQRMNADLQRQNLTSQAQAQNNSLVQGLGNLYGQSVQNQFGRQLAGSENNYNQLAGLAGLNMGNQALQQNSNNANFAQQQQTKTPSLGDALERGFVSGAGSSASQIAASPGTGASSFSNSFGKMMGAGM